jgi:CheY-like chemotaxis protein
MLGALSEQQGQDELDRLDVQGFLVKPLDSQELVAALSQPFMLAQASGGQPLTKPLVVPKLVTKRVLLAEDTPINQTLQTILLNRMGYEVSIANNGLEAVEAFQSGAFDLVLMDIQMPEMGGIEATRLIREHESAHQARSTPIIAVTANALKGDRESYLAAGMNGYVSKPISQESLKIEMARLMPETPRIAETT